MKEKSNPIDVQAILSKYTPEELAQMREEMAKEDERRKKISPVYLQIAFGFVDEQGNHARPKNDTYPYLMKVPLDITGKDISFVEQLIVENAVTEMIKNLVLSGQIDHLHPRIQDKVSRHKTEKCPEGPFPHLEVTSCSARIQEITDSPFVQNIRGAIPLLNLDTSSCKH